MSNALKQTIIIDNNVEKIEKIEKKDIRKSFFLWYLLCEMSNSYERMQSLAFCACLSPILKKLYTKKEDLSKALIRHLNFFNTQGTWGALIHGIVIAMEEEKANGADIPDETITGIKTGLMGPLAGIGDTIDWGTLKVIITAIGVTFAMTGSAAGAFIPFVFVIITFATGYSLWNYGYSLGRESVRSILEAGWIKELITGASIMGLFMMGALAANFVKISTPLTIVMKNSKDISVQGIFDSIAPGILPLAAVFGIYWYLLNKKHNFTKLLLIILAISLLGSLVGIF